MVQRILLLTFWILCIQVTLANPGSPLIFKENQKVVLKGDWHLVMGAFLNHDEISQNREFITAPVPGTWNDLEWNGEPIGPYGFGTYYKRVIVDEQVKQRLALEVSEVSLAYKLFINDELIGQRGGARNFIQHGIS